MRDFPFLNNNLFTSYTLIVDFPQVYDFTGKQTQAKIALDSIKALYDKEKFKNQNEHQFEDDFIVKVLEILGWEFVRQDEKIIQGKLDKPDFLLFSTKDSRQKYIQIPKEERKATNNHISVILESKAYEVEVDNKKIKDNPHFQLMRYLSTLRVDFGFLSNGRIWRFYDTSMLSSTKVFYEVNLEMLLENGELEDFNYFYHVFHASNFIKTDSMQSNLSQALEKNIQSKIAIEDDLQSIIYGINGKDSLFEKIGALIYAKNQDADLKDVYQNTLYFVFRLLFIAYFEDKFDSILSMHKSFKQTMSLYVLLEKLKTHENKTLCIGLLYLNVIFQAYNKGEPNIDVPIFNGGLFDEKNTPLLKTPKIFNDSDLIEILESLFNYQGMDAKNTKTLFRRDYRTLSIVHLGTIYEGLLSYFFDIAREEICYVVYEPKKSKNKLNAIEGYFDSYDYKKIEKTSTIHKNALYAKGQIYLKNTSNSRKSSASYYTPESITKFLVEKALENKLSDSNILHFKILDNACGSGHFLVEALNQITQIVQSNFDSFPAFKKLYEEEKQNVQKNICEYIEGYQADENDILKRLLLKRVIFGVDLSPFSIELTKLSLWIDSFIFGTPLSFLEHHIKCGNALIGTSISGFSNYYDTLQKSNGGNLFIANFLDRFKILSDVFLKLDSIRDTTEAEVNESKRLYNEEITPTLQRLNLFLNMLTAKNFMNAEEYEMLKGLEGDNIENLIGHKDYESLRLAINKYAKEYSFFNYEVEFPEIMQDTTFVGFDCIVGNPPWDETRFSDYDFFPQYQSNYRTLKNSEKEEFKENLLAKGYVKEEYERQKKFISIQNAYYQNHSCLAEGMGNLFRFFIERNLALLAKERSLNYVLPSALMLEKGSRALRKHILEEYTLSYFYAFENREGVFHDVHRSYKFALMQIIKARPDSKHKIKTMFYKTNIDEVYKKKNIIELSLKDIKALSPNQLALQEVRDKKDLRILRKCYRAYKPLSLQWLDFRLELSMTADKDLFIESFSKDLLPLYEGKMIYQFRANFALPQYFLDRVAFDERLRSKEIYRLKQDLKFDSKEYKRLLQSCYPKISKEEAENSFIAYDREFYRLGFRDIASDTNERTAIFSLLPKSIGCGNTLWSNMPKKYIFENNKISHKPVSHLRLCFALGIFNSLVLDFIARGMVQIHLNKTYLERIPLPQPSDTEILENKDFKEIARSALLLQLYHDNEGHFSELVDEFSTKLNMDTKEIPKTSKAYDILRAKLDISIAKLYGLEYDEFCYLLESFKVLQNKQPAFIALLKDHTLWEE